MSDSSTIRTTIRWLVAILAVVLVLSLLGWARGQRHHRGDEVGSFGITVTAVADP